MSRRTGCTIPVPPSVDVHRITASLRHGMRQLTPPLTFSVKPPPAPLDPADEETRIRAAV
jgi:hypothetical protein